MLVVASMKVSEVILARVVVVVRRRTRRRRVSGREFC